MPLLVKKQTCVSSVTKLFSQPSLKAFCPVYAKLDCAVCHCTRHAAEATKYLYTDSGTTCLMRGLNQERPVDGAVILLEKNSFTMRLDGVFLVLLRT